MKQIISIIICLIGIYLITIVFLQPFPCNKIDDLAQKKCTYLQVISDKNYHNIYKLSVYLNLSVGILCIICSILLLTIKNK